MRIVHLLFSSRLAGSERYCLDLANRQSAEGHEVQVLGATGSPLAAALAPGIRFHGFNRFLRGLRVRRLLDSLAPDICHGHLSAACKILGRASSRHQTVATLHVGYKPHQHDRLDGLICVNRAQTALLSRYQGMTRTIPNWLPHSPDTAATIGLREELGLDDSVFLMGAVGRLHASKGMDVLIAAFRASAPANAVLAILGEGPQRAELEKLRAGDTRIHLLGFRADVSTCLQDLDLFISPSREESFGLAIVEAMGAGLPVIATAAEGPAEYLRDQPVTLVPVGSVDALAAAIAEASAIAQADGLPRIGYDLSLFEPATRLESITDFYANIIGAKQHRDARLGDRVILATT
jgi:glycosyltransferase involved in cell wall biosynthesis